MDRETQYYERRLASIILEVGTDGDILLTDKDKNARQIPWDNTLMINSLFSCQLLGLHD